MIVKRLKQYIDIKGISVSAFERSIGMSNASFGKSLKNGGGIGSDKLENILNTYPDISPIWLMTGVGDMLINEGETDSDIKQVQDSSYVMHLMDRIASQAEEIGRLKERNAQLERENATLHDELSRGLPPQEEAAAQVYTHTKRIRFNQGFAAFLPQLTDLTRGRFFSIFLFFRAL